MAAADLYGQRRHPVRLRPTPPARRCTRRGSRTVRVAGLAPRAPPTRTTEPHRARRSMCRPGLRARRSAAASRQVIDGLGYIATALGGWSVLLGLPVIAPSVRGQAAKRHVMVYWAISNDLFHPPGRCVVRTRGVEARAARGHTCRLAALAQSAERLATARS